MSNNNNIIDDLAKNKEEKYLDENRIEDKFYNVTNQITSEEYVYIFLWLNGMESECAFKFVVNDYKHLNVSNFKAQIQDYINSSQEIKKRINNKYSSPYKIVHLYTIKEMDLEDSDISYLKENDVIFYTLDNSSFKPSNHYFLYKFVNWIKSGGYGKVFLAINILNRKEVAIKQIDTSSYTNEEMYNLSREHLILKNMVHKNVIKCIDFFAYDNKFFTVMEYAAGGELSNLLNEKGKISEKDAKILFEQIYNAVYFIHSKNIIHRDLKPNNILFLDSSRSHIVIIDFGISGFSNGNQKDTIKAGTIRFLPPEVVSGSNFRSSAKIDVWSLGVILYRMVEGVYPFDGKNTKEIGNRIMEGKVKFSKRIKISNQLRELIEGMLNKNIRFRIDMESDLFTNWFYNTEEDKTESDKRKDTVMRIINNLGEAKAISNPRKISINAQNVPNSINSINDQSQNDIENHSNDSLSMRKIIKKNSTASDESNKEQKLKLSNKIKSKKSFFKSEKRLNIIVQNKQQSKENQRKKDTAVKSCKNVATGKNLVKNKNSIISGSYGSTIESVSTGKQKSISDFKRDIDSNINIINKMKYYGKSPQKARCKYNLEIQNKNNKNNNNELILPIIHNRSSLPINKNKNLGRMKSTC